jgi:hypothetical protein
MPYHSGECGFPLKTCGNDISQHHSSKHINPAPEHVIPAKAGIQLLAHACRWDLGGYFLTCAGPGNPRPAIHELNTNT